ncbi:MAG: ERAP1-like C-terminal domain-containing protein, partial [Thermoplasmata archaeon]|nr:ERAP1-like C-terminal domain-containing protein [Thermoplasmata archaeon]
ISVEVSGETLQLRQRRYSFLGPEAAEPPWPIPLVLRKNGDSRPILFDQASVVVPLPSPGDLVVNPGRAAFVRTWYQTGLRERMISKIVVMDAVDRWAFLSDAAAFVLSGDYPLIDYLAAVREAHSVSDYPSVSEVAGSLQLLALGLGDRKDFQRAHLEFNRAQLDRIGMRSKAGESDTEPVLRERILENLTRVDDELARTLAKGFGQIDSLDPALRDATALAFARQGSAGAMDTLFQRLTSTASEDAAEQAAFALGGLPTSELLAEAMDRATAPGVRTQHLGYLVASAARNPLGRGVTWAWMQENLREFERRSEGSWMLAHLLQATIPSVGLDRTGEVIAYFARERFPEGRNGVQKGLEMLEVLARLRQRYSTDI